jgi:cyclopropane fatty-acyl-phospholipid synthase-like methyltransferase
MRQLLSHPMVYETFQSLMGAPRGRQILVRDVLDLRPGQRLLDIGCGPAGLLAAVPADVDYTGIDGSPEYIAAARARFGKRGTFIEGLIDPNWQPPDLQPFDRIVAIGLLHHLDESCRTLLRCARSLLALDGRFVSLDPVIDPSQTPFARYLVKRDRGEFIRTAPGYHDLAASVFDDFEGVVRNDLLNIPYTHYCLTGRAPAPA